jgi:hypothetical protein
MTNSRHPRLHRRRYTVERRFEGSVFDVADARRFARRTANWWGVDARSVDRVVDKLARRAMCSEQPGFRVLLSLDGAAMEVRVERVGADTSPVEATARIRSGCARGNLRRY